VISISDDGQFLYIGLDGSSSVQRFTLPSLAPDIRYSLGANRFDGPYFALYLQVAPGAPRTTAVTSGIFNLSPAAASGISIFDDDAMRPTIAAGVGSCTVSQRCGIMFPLGAPIAKECVQVNFQSQRERLTIEEEALRARNGGGGT